MLAQLGYLALFGAIFLETAGVPAPGESSLIAASVLAAAGKLNIALVIAAAAIAAIAGDNLGYLLGRRLGRRFLARPGRFERHRRHVLERGERFFARHGGKAVFIGRWLPFARVTAAWLAGAGRMRWRTFAIWNALGGVAWAASVGSVAYALGASGARILPIAGALGLASTLVLIVGLCRRAGGRLPLPSLACGGAHVG